MRTTRYLFLTLLMALFGMSAEAQQRNVLQVPDVTTQIGNVQLPVNIENTDEIVGAQFDLTLPAGVTAQPVGNLANRSDGHTVTISQLSSGAYRVLLHSGANRPLRGQSGVVMYLPITIPDTFEEGSEHQLTISNAVLGKSTGENVLTEVMAGKIRISKLPDLTVDNITADKQTLNPGDRLVCSWQVENIGELATGGGWSEQLSLVSTDGTQSKLIATTHYDDILDASGIVSRQAEVTLPFLLGVDGQVKLQVRIVPDSDTGESATAQANNTQTSVSNITINKLLSLELSPKRIDENSTQRIALRVNRSGRWSVAETFTIAATTDSRVNIPTSITIPANQSGAVVYFRLTDNDVLDNDTAVNITVTGNDYPEAETTLIIDDNELPSLSVTTSKMDINEGETFQLTITTSRVSSNPITVTLTCENARRFNLPAQVVIPAGEASVTVDVTAVDNDEIELEESIAFRASANRHERGECIVMLSDNDMPTLTFTLSPEAVSEADGYAALLGVIKRTDNLDKRVTLKLSDDSNGLLTYTNQTIVMAKGQAEVQFNIGVTDNDLVDGNHVVNVTAAVYASSCDCSVSGENKGSMTATVTIIDDDGPTLKIKPAGTAMLEGSEGNVFAVSHNVQSEADIIVRISSDKDDMLEYDHELTIPAGQSTANLFVNVKSNDQQDDSNIATFKVEANGYAMGTCWILITDQTLPDATISLTADKTESEAEGTVLLRAVVKNVGNAPLRSTTPVEVSFSGRTDKVKLTVGKTVAVGDSAVIEYNYDLPAITGNHTFEATVNATGKVPELIYANNTSEKVGITIISPFSVTAQTDKDIYHQGDSIHVSGVATGNAGKNAKVEVYFINEGARQTVSATTDEEGNYIVGWKPLSRQSGHFIVGACYPGAKETEEMDAFDVYGIRATDNFKTCELSQTDTQSGKIIITNPGNLAQTGLTVTPKAESENCVFTYDVPTSIGAGKSVEIAYTITGNEISEGRDWQQMPLEITTAEGAHLDYTIYYYVHSLKARLQTNQSYINTTMTYGIPREYPVTIKNVGRTETGKITLALPNWIQAVTPSEMASLAQGDSATILLRFIPTDAMKLNVRVSGHIGINCSNGDGTSISFYLTPVSETKGKLKVDVVDEYTYFTTEAPHVSNAKVQVKNPSTNEVVAEGETADDGTFTAEIPEGYYSVTVDADKHDSYANTVIIDPGVEKNEEVFLSYQAITYSWEVEETSVEDEYEIETIVKYETRVPKPVVIITLPDEQPEPNSIIPVILTNKGLVNAVDVNLSLSISNGYKLEFLNDPMLEVLAPQQAHVFYAKMVPDTDEEAGARAFRASSTSSRCFTLIARARYKELCQKYTGEELAEQIKKWGTRHCVSSSTDDGGRTGGSYSPGYPGNWGNTNYDSYYRIYDTDNPVKFCDNKPDNNDTNPDDDNPEYDPDKDPFWTPCKAEVLAGSANCVANLGTCWIPGVGCAVGIGTSCVLPAATGRMTGFAFLGCLGSIVGCGFGPVGSCVMAGIGCAGTAVDTYLTCNDIHVWSGAREVQKSKRAIQMDYNRDDPFDNFFYKMAVTNEEMKAYVGYVEEIFGNVIWLESNPEEVTKLLDYLQSLSPEDVVEMNDDMLKLRPSNVSQELFQKFIERYNNTTTGYDSNYEGIENYIRGNVLVDYANTIEACEAYAQEEGFPATQEMIQTAYESFMKYLDSIKKDEDIEDSPSICSTITLSFKQKNVMTRQAFRGTLTVNNGNETTAMKDVKMNLEVRDMDGNLTTSHEFQIDAESLNGFVGDLDFTSGWTLGGGETGVATILFIPTKYAAPTEPKDYSFGGSFSYTDPYTGLTVTRDLNPVTLTVNPSPNLEMTYFMQRDVFGDDPLTETVEPMIPSEFALVVNNKGYGDAENMSLTTQQPEIIDNQKGLVINFELISTQLNGGDKNLSLGGSMISDFGTIPAHSQAYAQWWLQSSLLGHFIEYEVKATHITSRNNPDLSLLDTVTVHELIHGFMVRTDGDKPLRGFLVNDIKDKDDMPDVVYFTDATQQVAYIASGANIVKQSDTEYVLNVNVSTAGWNYGSLLDPTYGKQKLVKVTRADGTEVNVDNIWQTDRTLRDGKDPLYENRLHFVGNMAAEGETFYLTFEPKPAVELEVESYVGIPEEGTVLKEQLTTMTVKFNKPIKAESFTNEDITLTCQGVAQDASQIVLEKQNEQEFKLTLNEVTLLDGYYVLTVQTAGIEDNEGFNGSIGKQATWIQFVDGTIALKVSASPADGGIVTPESGRYEYGNDVTLNATPAKGYIFNNWTRNGEIVSTNPEYTTQSISNVEMTAHFSKISYSVEIESNGEGGSVSGAGSGIYEYGTQLSLKAEPFEDYMFKEWSVNGTSVDADDGILNIVVEESQEIIAVFKREYYNQEIEVARGWNWLSSYLDEPLDLLMVSDNVNRVVGQFDELIRDPQYGLVGGLDKLSAGCAYKIDANRAFTDTFRGHLYDIEAKPLQLHKGWNWIAFPYMEDISLSTAVANAEEGDYMVSQRGFAEFAEGQWQGSLRTLSPGEGYLYKSASDKILPFDFSSGGSSSRAMARAVASDVEQSGGVDIHRYPNTMNMTIQVYKDDVKVSTDDFCIHAFVGEELRGISQQIGSNHYLTVYGEEPVNITFVVESVLTGEEFAAAEILTFCNDVVGSRKTPFILHLGNATGINSLVYENRPMTIYSIEGILISRDATLATLKKLPKGVYIINGQKCFIK